MDRSDPEIVFNENGVCNHCVRYDEIIDSRVFKGDIAHKKLKEIVKKIKISSKKNEYDCIIGVSGGVDSSYVAFLTKELGLNPLAIHFDNGWNSEIAVDNIKKILDKLNIDLYTYVVDWDMFSDLQKAFLKCSTPDGEAPTDHAINALLFKEAGKRGIKYILSGMNFASESMDVRMWSYGTSDFKYIKDVYNKYGNGFSLKDYPHFTLLDLFYWTFFKRIKVVSILNYIDYNKDYASEILQKQLNWTKYSGKHYESVYTRFYQGFFLPQKFGIDKRLGHCSDLIRAGQISRDKALKLIKQPPYLDSNLLKIDKDFVQKKLNLSDDDFDEIMKLENRNFMKYKNSSNQITRLKKIVNFLRSKGLYSK